MAEVDRAGSPSLNGDERYVANSTAGDASGAGAVSHLLGSSQTCIVHPGSEFIPEASKEIVTLNNANHNTSEARRSQSEKVGSRVSPRDDAAPEKSQVSRRLNAKPVDIMISLMSDATPFHTPDGTAFADVSDDGRRETLQVASAAFSDWLQLRYFDETGSAPSSSALKSALRAIEAKAGPRAERSVYVRVAGSGGKLYLDLCDETQSAVEIDTAGWRVINNPPVRFLRPPGMLPLPTPTPGGSISVLRPLINVRTNSDFKLVVGCLLAALRDCGPYPLLAISGEQGSAKSFSCDLLQAVVDPHVAPLRALPTDNRELFIEANHVRLLVFDNVLEYSDGDVGRALPIGHGWRLVQAAVLHKC